MSTLDRLVAALAARQPVAVEMPERPFAAVALLLAPDPDRMVVIRRSEHPADPWSGHLALPGGRREGGDPDLTHTAIRETAEETGIILDPAWQCAVLDDLAPMTPILPPIVVRPFVFRLPVAVAPGLSGEVAHAEWVSFEALRAPGVYRETQITLRGAPRSVHGYHLTQGLLWGMTERIVTPVIERWAELRGASC